MIELDERDVRLIQRIEIDNCTDYEILQLKGRFFIDKDNLLSALEDTQDYRKGAEESFKEYKENEYEKLCNDNPNVRDIISYRQKVGELTQENYELKRQLEQIQNTLDEDDYDRLAEEGIELYERD